MTGHDHNAREAAFWQSHADEPPTGVPVSAAMIPPPPSAPTMSTVIRLREELKRHATDRYEDGGWDVIVECWEDAAIDSVLVEQRCLTFADVLAAFEPLVGVWADRQADARNSAF